MFAPREQALSTALPGGRKARERHTSPMTSDTLTSYILLIAVSLSALTADILHLVTPADRYLETLRTFQDSTPELQAQSGMPLASEIPDRASRTQPAAATWLLAMAPPYQSISAPAQVTDVPSNAIAIAPGTTIQHLVNISPPGTAFLLKAGLHRLQSVQPKDGNTFLGESGAIMSGARLLTGFLRQSNYWFVSGQTQQSSPAGECKAGYPRCGYAEDVYIDDVLQKHVDRLSDVVPGTFYFDYAADRIYIGQDPAGHIVEAAVARTAFQGVASSVTIRGLTIEKYATPTQVGTIMASLANSWTIEGNDVRWNHGVGVVAGPSGKVRSNNIHHNGQLGIAADGSFVLIESNEIAWNNTAGYEPGFEGGASKFAETQDLTVRANYVHHNYGAGLWTDIDNIRTTYEDNTVTDNEEAGIFHEISYSAVIRNNKVYRNGTAYSTWLWGAQILIANSQGVEVTGNTISVGVQGGNGISLIQQNRGSGRYGQWKTLNNYIHHNDITYLGRSGQSGAVADYEEQAMLNGNNHFDHNTYHFGAEPDRWFWGAEVSFAGMHAVGQELGGKADRVVIPAP